MKLIETKANEFFDLNENDSIITIKYMDYEIKSTHDHQLAQKYSPIIEVYKEIIKETSHFINNTITTNNILSINGAITFLIWNGYTSYNQQFSYTTSPLLNNEQFNVILGQGCCRHIAGFANAILNQLDISSRLLANYLGDIRIASKFKLPITRMYEDDISGAENDINDIDGRQMNSYNQNYLCNHLCIIFPYQDDYLMYDPTNLLLFSLKGVKANCLFGKGYAIISPYDFIYRYGMTKNEVDTYIHSLTSTKNISRKESKQIYKFLLEGVTKLKNNIDECEQFHRKIKEPIEYIHQYQCKEYIKKLKNMRIQIK